MTFRLLNPTIAPVKPRGQKRGVTSSLPPLPADPRPGRYRHYKGGEYRVIGLARHSESLEPMVVYEALYGEGGLWVRPAAMFKESFVDATGTLVRRFAPVADI